MEGTLAMHVKKCGYQLNVTVTVSVFEMILFLQKAQPHSTATNERQDAVWILTMPISYVLDLQLPVESQKVGKIPQLCWQDTIGVVLIPQR